jgi:hypothetical protein
VTTSSTDKAKAFKMYLIPGCEADEWFATLSVATHVHMDLIDTQYPAEVTVQPTLVEYATDVAPGPA